MKRILFILFLTIPFIGYSQNYFHSSELTSKKRIWEGKGDVWNDQIDPPCFSLDVSKKYLKKDMTPVTGIVFGDLMIETYKDGELISSHDWWTRSYGEIEKRSENNLKEGKFHGIQKIYFKKNILKSEQNYKDGKLHGTYKEWDRNGFLRIEVEFENDKPVGGVKIYDSNGNIERETFHQERLGPGFGRFDTSKPQKYYYENGMIKKILTWEIIDGKEVRKELCYNKKGDVINCEYEY